MGRISCAVISPQLETSELIRIGRDDPGGVMDISAWYQLFLCGQIHHKLTDVRCSLSHCCVGCVRLLRRSSRDSEVCQPNTSSINVIDDVTNRNQSERIYYFHLAQPLSPQWNHPHTASPRSHIHTHSPTHAHKRQITTLSHSHPYAHIIQMLRHTHTHTQKHLRLQKLQQPILHQNLSSPSHQICQPAASASGGSTRGLWEFRKWAAKKKYREDRRA